MSTIDYFATLKNPGSVYRGFPFWAWNGKLEEEELRRQIRVMKQMGLGGFFMHSRIGLETEYLSDEWFDCVRACIDEAEKNGLKAWLYDEDRWPSGAAGGKVTCNKEFRQRMLICREINSLAEVDLNSSLAVFAVNVKDEIFSNPRRIKHDLKDWDTNDKIFDFYVKTASDDDWFNGEAYLDTLNPEAVKKFIDVTHEKYKNEIGENFGKIVPGIFTDEPRFDACEANADHFAISWTDKLTDTFQERYGYDLIEHLPELFFDMDVKDHLRARYHFYDCLTYLFTNSFARLTGEWCEKNNIMFTGHVNDEDYLSRQARSVGSCMRFYEFMQAPGMDVLTERYRVYDTAKQVSSAARQFNRKWRLTETYGCTGWDFNFAGHKAIGDWQAALGINMRAQHLSWYTMQGAAKRDYPASILHQSPWWEIYTDVENYFARLNLVLSEGNEVRDLLVIHPIESMWLQIKPEKKENSDLVEYDYGIGQIRDMLLTNHLDFDYGDEDIIARYGSVEGSMLKVGAADYKAVLVPELHTMRSTTLELLKIFKSTGGQIVFAGKTPEMVDGVKNNSVKDFAKSCEVLDNNFSGKSLCSALEANTRRVSICSDDGKEIPSILYQLREDSNSYNLFICNTGQGDEYFNERHFKDLAVNERNAKYDQIKISVNFQSEAQPLELCLENGEMHKLSKNQTNGQLLYTRLAPLQSRLFVFPKSKNFGSDLPFKRQYVKERHTKFMQPHSPVDLSEENVLVLDMPEYKLNDEEWQAPDEILKIDDIIRNKIGLPLRQARGKQPWAQKITSQSKVKASVNLRYKFDIDQLPSNNIFLGIENPGIFRIEINNQKIDSSTEAGWWRDLSLRKIEVPLDLLKTGNNTLILEMDYCENFSGLEVVYLLGEFGVWKAEDGCYQISSPVTTMKFGDWTRQGLPFYAGAVKYKFFFGWPEASPSKLFIKVPAFDGAAVKVIINKHEAGIISLNYKEVEISEFVVAGKNELCIEVFGHCRNSHGPLHYNKVKPDFISTEHFFTSGNEWTDEYVLVSCGLNEAPQLIIRELNDKLEKMHKSNLIKGKSKWKIQNSKIDTENSKFLHLSNSSL